MASDIPIKETDSSQPKWLTILRVALGLILFWKGISFIRNSLSLQTMVRQTGIGILDKNAETISFIITYANLLGGFLIIVGLFTRWASIIQIPILIGAVFLVNAREEMNVSSIELILSGIVLILLVIFAIKGSGAISADEYFHNYYKAGYESGHTKKFLE